MNTLIGVRLINSIGTVDSVVINHNHKGTIRDRGECPACDEFYGLHCDSQAA